MADLLQTLNSIRQVKAPLPIPPGVEIYWSKDPNVSLRPYQIAMVWNMILCPAFLCGDSVGLGKCFASDTLLWTSRGLVRVSDLGELPSPGGYKKLANISVITDKGSDISTHVYNDGIQKTRRVTLSNGLQLECTPEHPVKAITESGNYQWVKFKDLGVGGTLAITRNKFCLPCVPVKLPGSKLNLPELMTPDLGLFLGLVIGDGHWRPEGILLTSKRSDTEVQDCFKTLCLRLFGKEVTFRPQGKRDPDLMTGGLYSRDIMKWLHKIGLAYDRHKLKFTPWCVLQGGPEVWKAFLSGILATDGHITKEGRFDLTMHPELLIREIQQIFWALGVSSKLSTKHVKPSPGNGGGDYWRIDLNGPGLNDLPEIFKYNPLTRKNALLRTNWFSFPRNKERFGSYKNLQRRFLLLHKECPAGFHNLNPANSELGVSNFNKYYLCVQKYTERYRGKAHAAGHPVKILSESAEANLENLRWIYDNVTPLEIVKIEESISNCYDLVVPSSHTFIANGFISHNTAMGSAAISAIKASHPETRFLVYTTSSAQRQWVEEIRKFTSLRARMLQEKGRKVKPKIARLTDFRDFIHDVSTDPADVLVMRYSSFLADGEFQIDAMKLTTRPVCVIYDEATAFKTPDTKTSLYAQALSNICQWKYGLSATPIENHLTEIYNIFKGLGIQVFGSLEWFRYQYCIEQIQGYRRQWDGFRMVNAPVTVTVGYKNLDELNTNLAPYFWARSQAEVGEQLPLLNTETIELEMNAAQIAKTEDIWEGIYSIDHVDEVAEVKAVSSKMTVLLLHQMVSVNPAILSDRPEDYLPAPTSPKEEALFEMLNTRLEGSKTIVYTRFRREIERLKILIPKETGRNVLYIHGDMDPDSRYDMMRKFQTDPNENLIIINAAAFQAVNLQQAANLICLDLPWAWGALLQLVGRMVRLKSPHAICNLYILNGGGIDNHVIHALKDKKGIFERVLSPSASLGVFDETDHEIINEGSTGFISTIYDTLILQRKRYKRTTGASDNTYTFD